MGLVVNFDYKWVYMFKMMLDDVVYFNIFDNWG